MSKNWRVYLIILAIILVAIILFLIFKPAQPVEPPGDLLGAWRLNGDFLQSGGSTSLLLQVNQLTPATGDTNTYLGAGCMQTEASEGWAPLSLQAVLAEDSASYTLNMLSTLVGSEFDGGGAVIRLVGGVEMGSGGTKNDRASGTAYTTAGEIEWSGAHSSLTLADCPDWDDALVLQAEFEINRDRAYIPDWDIINFQAETLIASSQMQIEAPDGQVILADYYTDIFTPEVNFIDQFRFHYAIEGTPIIGEPYQFTLLDVLGEPISGAEGVDTFNRCDQGAATNLRAVVHLRSDNTQVDYVELLCDAPQIIPNYFDPSNGYGLYQLALHHNPWREGDPVYGAEMNMATHHIPWDSFEPGAAGFPDGNNYGISLSELDDGQYILFIGVYSYYDPDPGNSGFDCRVTDSRQALFFSKQDNQIGIQPAGAISGFIYDSAGNPLEGVAVEINGVGTGFYEKVCSRENGFYLFTRLLLDTFTLSAGGFGAEECPPNGFALVTQPGIALDSENPIRESLDFLLAP